MDFNEEFFQSTLGGDFLNHKQRRNIVHFQVDVRPPPIPTTKKTILFLNQIRETVVKETIYIDTEREERKLCNHQKHD